MVLNPDSIHNPGVGSPLVGQPVIILQSYKSCRQVLVNALPVSGFS